MWINPAEESKMLVIHNFVHLYTLTSTRGVYRDSYHHVYQHYVDNFIHRVFKTNI